MKRMKRLSIRRIALGFAFAALAIPAVGQAKPVPGDGPILNGNQQSQDSAYLQAMSRGNVYIPLQGDTSMADSSYLQAVSRGNVYIPLQGDTTTAASLGPDDRAVSRATSQPVLSPYRSWGPRSISSETGSAATVSPDDRAFSKATSVGQVPYSGKVESGDDTSKYAASAFALVLLAMSGITLVVWRNRKGGKLSPA